MSDRPSKVLGGWTMLEKITKKAVDKVKQTVKEETHKTTEEIKSDVLSAVKEVLPELLVVAAGIVGLIILKKPTPVVVKVIVKQV